ncbi:MAG: Nramp family divalent metal transporter [Planctomycetota bacterium]|jgi:Mn2+/Fe2+ NRAMP family transporter
MTDEDTATADGSPQIQAPPTTFGGTLRHLGPSMILSASIVGSGELIMTTTLGAQAGFVALWIILVSCLVKVCVQLEFGKHAISSGQTTMTALNALRGPPIAGAGWAIWMWLIVQVVIFFQYGGIVTGVGQALHITAPALPVWAWATLAGLIAAALVAWGRYRLIENLSIALMALFTLFTLLCVGLLQGTEYAISLGQLAEGFRFTLPEAALGAAVAAFGLTGVGASEIIAYPYWCLEKGYAGYTGPREATDAWAARARGWIRVMYWDAFVSMLVYTLVTCAFFVLGAAVLHGRGEIPQGSEMIATLSKIYTESAGPGAMTLYLVGAIVVLFSTLFAGTAAWTRMFSDAFAQMGRLDYNDPIQRRRWIVFFAWFFPLSWTVLGLTFKAPVALVTAGGIANAALLLMVVYAAFSISATGACRPSSSPGASTTPCCGSASSRSPPSACWRWRGCCDPRHNESFEANARSLRFGCHARPAPRNQPPPSTGPPRSNPKPSAKFSPRLPFPLLDRFKHPAPLPNRLSLNLWRSCRIPNNQRDTAGRHPLPPLRTVSRMDTHRLQRSSPCLRATSAHSVVLASKKTRRRHTTPTCLENGCSEKGCAYSSSSCSCSWVGWGFVKALMSNTWFFHAHASEAS